MENPKIEWTDGRIPKLIEQKNNNNKKSIITLKKCHGILPRAQYFECAKFQFLFCFCFFFSRKTRTVLALPTECLFEAFNKPSQISHPLPIFKIHTLFYYSRNKSNTLKMGLITTFELTLKRAILF